MKSLLITLVASLALCGCGGKPAAHTEAEKAATDAARAWLDLMDNAKYTESWEQSAAPFKTAMTADGWAKMAKPVREPLGKVSARTLANADYMTKIPNAPEGEYVIIQFKTDFENKKGAVETVTPMKEDGKWKVSGYYIK